ncbi:MAG: hypothetical protein ABDH28_03275, partial [Brevinematia bacterium]
DSNNSLLETSSGNLENGYASWTSVKIYTRNIYIVVVKIDMTGDRVISTGADQYSYKYVIVSEDSDGRVSFSDTDEWYGM